MRKKMAVNDRVTISVALIWISLSVVSAAASFYGSSYIALPLQEARSTTDLSFRFRTSRPDALLFLAAGRTDYCLVVLQSAALKVRINLGAGEAEVATPRGLRLDDLAWHDVRIHRKDADFTLTVDGLHSSKLKLPGRFYELNIHYGIFVGGLGDFREIFLGLWDNFRGCLNELNYNGVDVLAKAKDRDKTSSTAVVQTDGNAATVVAVSWDCSAEFDATSDKDISFLSTDSYVTFGGTGIAKTGSTLRFQLKTQSRDCVLLYSSGTPAKPDFAAVELVEGHLRVSLDAGGGSAVDLFSDLAVNDGLWHQVQVHLAAGAVELKIDARSSSSSSGGNSGNSRDSGFIAGASSSSGGSSGSSKYLELSGQIYLGGIETARQSRAIAQGVRTANTSLRGCIRRLELDSRLLGLRDARVTRHVAPECQWQYPCVAINPSPCVDGGQCIQDGVDHFRCECPQPPCTKPEFVNYRSTVTSTTSVVLPTSPGNSPAVDVAPPVLNLSPVQVTEGGSMTLTSRHLQVQLDYEKFGVRESGVLFHVVRPPQYGRLFSTLWRRADEATFTLLDVHSDRIRYVHDGSETLRDSALLELELAPRQGFLLPAYLQKRQRFVLHLAVSPVNDPPELSLAPGKAVLRLVKHTRKALTQELLAAFDPDNQPKDLVYSVLNSKSDGDMEGSIENKLQPGVAISSFTQEDVNQGRIWYVHRGSPNGRLALRVSDGAESGPTAVLRIAAFDLQIFLANNTGLLVPVNGSAALTAANLTFITNAPDQELDIRYDVTRPPQHGQMQIWRSGRWQQVNWFTSGQLLRGERIRYLHQPNGFQPPAVQDDFQFSVSVALEVAEVFRSPIMYQFRFQLLDAVLRQESNQGLSITGSSTQMATIGSSLLRFVTEPHSSAEEEVVYTLVDPPLFGSLWIQSQSYPLESGSKWTQSALHSQRLQYRLARRTLSSLRDRFTFRVASTGIVSGTERFEINFTPGNDTSKVSATLGQLLVNEGETSVVQPSLLGFSVPMAINYTLLEKPKHGQLNLLSANADASKRSVMRKNISWFSSDDVNDLRVVYTHDDSESITDHFQFLARPRTSPDDPSLDFQYVGTFSIRAHMKNDNQPVRVGDQVLRVVTNGERRITPDILRYVDPDVDTSPSNIIFSRRVVPNGAFYLTERPDVAVFQFSQEDINEGKILFRHSGSDYGRTTLWVTDSQFHVTGTLEVQASEPFLERINQTRLTVRRGYSAPLGIDQLGMISNLDHDPSELIFHVIDEPQHGLLKVEGSDAAKIELFTQEDLLSGKVTYSSGNQTEGKDWFKLRASLRRVESECVVEVRTYPESYWLPLKVIQNQVVTVEEGTSFTIDSTVLKIGHPSGVSRHDVTYIVHQPPLHGYLEVDRDENEYEDMVTGKTTNLLPPEVHLFDQSVVDEQRLHYIQSGANQSSDQFVFDVTNGVVTLTNLTFQLAIIPKSIYLLTRPIEVLEGGHTILTISDLKIVTRYYADKVDSFLIVKLPAHGTLQLKGSSTNEEPLTRFTYLQLIEKKISYWHDGSEEANDTLEIVALAGKKESLPATIHIQVRPVDDERPVLANNTGILVWQGSTTLLDRRELGAYDVDTLPESIEFTFGRADCGYFVSGPNLSDPVTTFTQQEIDQHQIAFVHQGRTNCSISFNLTDGQSAPASQHQLQISARKMQMRLVRNERLHVFPMMQQSITSAQLLALTNGDIATNHQQNVPRFHVSRPPRLGRLLLEQPDGSTKRITSFTQRDLNQSLVIYEHTEPFADLSVNDSFVVDVMSDLSAPLQHQQFNIEISVATMAEGGLDRYLGLVALETEEGGRAVIREKNLNLSGIVQLINNYQGVLAPEPPRLRLILSQVPLHGVVSVNDRRLTLASEMTANEIASGKVEYQHDHSDTLEDWIGLTVLLQRPEKGFDRPDILLFNGTLRVNILPVNDQIFQLLTKAPAMTVVQRQWRAITAETLLTEDADTAAKDLVYEIIQPPKYGKLTLTMDNTTSSAIAIATSGPPLLRFSQEDINRGRVIYLHDGTMDPRSTSFYFRVSDGHFKADSGVFTIHFEPLTLRFANHSLITIMQGQSTAVVSNSSMGAESNGQRRHIFYNVTKEPENGRLYINDVHVTTFGQSNIDKDELLYVQFNMTTSADWFQVTVWNMAVSLEKQIFNVSVTPLLTSNLSGIKRPIRTIIGEKTPITIAALDAGKLASLTNSNPTFTIIRKPRYGKIRKIIPSSSSGINRLVKRQSSGNKEKDTNVFTHEDIQSQFIFYAARKLDSSNETHLTDSCEFRLTAPNVQPAIGVIEFLLLPSGSSGSTLVAASKNSIDVIQSQTSSPNFGNSRQPSSPDIVTENTLAGFGLGVMTNDIFLIVGIVCGILGLGLVILITIKCRMKPPTHKHPKNDAGNTTSGDMQLYRLSGTPKNGHQKGGVSDFQVTDAYRIPPNMHHHARDFGDTDSDPEPPPPPRLDYLDPPLSPRPSRAMRGIGASPISASSTISSINGRIRGSWHQPQQHDPTASMSPSVPQCKIIPLLNPLLSERSESETSELVNARYPYGIADESMEEWAMLDPDVHGNNSTYSSRTTNPMLRKNQYWV